MTEPENGSPSKSSLAIAGLLDLLMTPNEREEFAEKMSLRAKAVIMGEQIEETHSHSNHMNDTLDHHFPPSLVKALSHGGVNTIGELTMRTRTGLLAISEIGPSTVNKIEEVLTNLKLKLAEG